MGSVEFYTILFVIAAMAVAAIAMPKGKGAAETGFLTGELDLAPADADNTPRVEFACRQDGAVVIRRYGLPDLTAGATVALAVTRVGFDISIEERITPADPRCHALLESEAAKPVNRATFVLHGLGHERYHFKYNSDPTSTYCALTFRNIPGLETSRPMA